MVYIEVSIFKQPADGWYAAGRSALTVTKDEGIDSTNMI